MGAPKQKWTAEEESALKAGVKKHGIGKWRNILRDPEFSMDLRLRSNIDLKVTSLFLYSELFGNHILVVGNLNFTFILFDRIVINIINLSISCRFAIVTVESKC